MAFAITLSTESSDQYIFVLEGEPTQKEILKYLEEQMDRELYYVYSYKTAATYKIKFKLPLDEYEKILDQEREEEYDNEEYDENSD